MANKIDYKKVLVDFMADIDTKQYTDEEIFGAYPEFNNDKSLLDAAYQYANTVKANKYYEPTLLSKFPEFFDAQDVQGAQEDKRASAFGGMADPLYSGQYQYHQQVAENEAALKREKEATLPLSQQDIERQAKIDQLRQEQYSAGIESGNLLPSGKNAFAIDMLERQKPSYLTRKAQTPQDVYDITMEAWTANTPEGQKAKAQADKDTDQILTNIKQQFDADVDGHVAQLQKQFEAEPGVKNLVAQLNKQFSDTEFKQLKDRVNRGELSVEDAQAQADAVWKEKYAPQIQEKGNALWKEKYVPQVQQYADKLWEDTYKDIYSNEASLIQKGLMRQMSDANQDYLNQQLRKLGQAEVRRSTQDMSANIAPQLARLEKERSEAISRASSRGQMAGGAYGAIGAQMSANTASPERDEKIALLKQAQEFLHDAQKISDGAAQGGKNFWKDLAKGFGANIGDIDTWDFGISQLARSANLKSIVEKYEKDKNSLTPEEKSLMDAAVTYMASCAYNSDKLSRGYKAGQTTAESLPFMLQFLIMPVDAVKNKVAKGILGYGIDQFGGKALQEGAKYTGKAALKEAGTLLLGNVAAAGMQTAAFGMPKIAGGTISRMTGDIKPDFDEQGHLVYAGREHMQNFGNALWNSTVDTYVENLSEMILTSGDPVRALIRGSEWFGKTIGKSEVVRFLANLEKTPFGQLAGRMQFRNYPEEVAEEYVGNLIKWGASTDIHSTKEAGLDADSQIDLWLGLAPTSIAFAGLGLGSYAVKGGIDLWQNVAAANKMRDIIGEGVERRYFEDMIKSKNSEEFLSSAREFVKGVLRDKKISDDEKREILDNVYISYQSQLAKEAEQVQQAEEQQEVQQQQARITQEVQTEVQPITHQDGNLYHVGVKGKDGVDGYVVSGNLNLSQDEQNGSFRTSGRDLVTIKMSDGTVEQVPADEVTILDAPMSATDRVAQEVERRTIIEQGKQQFHAGDKVQYTYVDPLDNQLKTVETDVLDVTDEGVVVAFQGPNGVVDTTPIPFETAMQNLQVIDSHEVQGGNSYEVQGANLDEEGIVTFRLPDNRELHLRDMGNGTYQTIPEEEGEEPYRFTTAELQQLGAQKVEQAPVQPVQGQAPAAPVQPVQPAQPQIGSNAPGIDELSAEDFAAQTVSFMQSPKVAQGYLTAERAKVNAQLQQLEKEGVTEYNSAEEYRTKAQQLEQSKARLQAQLEKIDGAIAAINAQAEAAVARKNLNEAIRKRAAEFSKQLGANIVIFDSLEQIPESQAAARAAYQKVGDDLDAWYDETTGDIYMNANAFEDMQRFEEKVFHEVVSHKGLDQLLGKAKYEKLCDAVWNSMSEASRNQYMAYARATHIRGSEKEFQRIAAKEYIAFLSERRAALELNDQSEEANTIRSEWAKICEFLKDLFSKIFGNVQITDEDLAKLVHASFVNMQRQAQGITEEQGETNGVEAIFKPIMNAVAQWQGQPLINGLDPKKIGLSALNPDYARNKIRQIQELLNKPEKTAEDVAAIDGILGELYGALNTLIGSRQGGNENNNAESLINDIALQIAKSGAISQELLDSYVNEFAAAHNEEVNYGNNGMDSYIGGNSMWMRSALDRESGNTHDAERAEKKRRKEEAAAAAAAQKKITEEQQAVIDQLSQESAVGTTFVDGKSTYTITGVAHENEDGDMVVPVHVEKNGKTRDFEEDAVVIANKMLKAKPAAPVKQETKETEDHTAAEFLNEALTETAKGNVPANVTIDETTIRDEEDSVEMDARLLIDGKPSNLSVTIFDQSLGSRGGYDPANLVKYYPFDNADNWSWEKADVLVNFFNKGEHSGKASVLDESDAVYFTSLQAAMEFAEFVNSDAANSPEVRLALAEAETDPNPTEAQKKAENYKQGHVTLWGLPITIENPKGSIRRGTDANGKQWEQEMHHTYGKIRRTEGVDGDHIDVFIGPNLTSDKVFVVDQRNVDTGEFDEHKCMLGFDSLEDAQNGYLSNYEEGWQGMGTVTEVTMDEFKKWIDSSHRKTKPFAEYKSVKPEGAASTAMEQTEEEPEIPAEEVKAMLDKLRALVENEEDQQAPQDYLHSLTDEQMDALYDEANAQWNATYKEQGLAGLNDPQLREKYPEAWKQLLLRNRVGSEHSRRYDMETAERSIANRKAHTESDELRRYYEYEFDYMRASARRDPNVVDYVNKAQEYLAKLSYDELAKIYNEVVRLQSEHDVPWILTKAYRDRTANMSNAGVFDYGLKQQGDIPAGKANKPKINANDWTANDELRPVMNGVYHDVTGVGVATNAHILLATPALYNPEHEGKIILKNGSTVDGKFPNWQGVFDQARRVCVKEATVDWDAIRNFIAGVKAKMKAEGHPLKKDSLANIIIRMPDGQVIIYRMNMFIPFADAAASVGANTLHYSPINGQTYAENNGSQLIIMPVDPESFKKAMDWGDVDNFYYDLQTPSEGGAAETPAEAPKAAKPKPTRKKAAPAEQTQAPVETDAEVIETQKPKNTDKIEDVGEKIGGARKDIVQETVDRINVNGDSFAKIFPKFDYHKLIANGLEPRLAAGLKYVCEHAKKSYKIRKKRFGENNALEATRFMANYAKGYLLGDTSLDFTSEGWVFTAYGKRRYEFGIKLWESLREAMGDTMFDVDLSGYDCDVIQSEEERKAEAEEKGRTYRPSSSIYYRRNADGESVEFTPRYAINTPKGDKLFTAEEYDQAVQYFQDQVTSAINYQAANPFELAIYRKRGSDDCCVHAKIGGKWVELTPWGKEYGLKYRDEHRAELQAMAQRKAEELKEQRKNTRPEAKVELRLTRREDGTYGNQFQVKLGKEYVPIKDDIMPITDSYNYLREHREELTAKAQEMLNAYLDEQEANRGWKPQLNIGGLRNRVGTDWRNGADVTAERFRTEFGFRGVEFGNYVTQKERQRLLNECFDALHDMAEILGVSPRALSLNCQLGFAIGARGGAGAKAHYEPGKNVINLTKKNGWGALAHEWWHAMDYYFGKREKERPATGGVFRDDVRKQMQDAFAAVMKAINGSEYLKRSQNLDAKTNKHYYAEDTELGARAFEDYIAKQLIARGQVNDFLSHHTAEEDWNGDISNYPYPIEKDGTALADAFQSFFDTVEEQEDASTGNSVLFSVTDKKYAQFALTQANNPMLDDVHTGIRSVEDIHTLEETLNDDKLLVTEPDWEEEDIRRAIEDNQVTVYSSHPIKDGTFVTPSRMVAEDYAGGEMVYEKTVSPDKVAWIASDEGQYADVDHYDGNILFSITNANNEIFYSNAERAVESIKQEKATPEQWRSMIEKAGGLKAGEDKWIGLSDWLAQQRPTIESHPDETPLQFAQRAQAERKKFTISKQEILHYIRANKIQIEETEYGETTPENNPTFRAFQDEVTEMWENVNRMQNGRFNEANQDIIRFEDDMQAKYGDDWRDLMDDSERNVANYLQERRDEINMEVFLPEEVVMEEMCNRHGDDFQLAFSIDDDGSLSIANEDAAGYYLDVNPINDTRLQYTTEGLTNKHEIAMTVPTIEAWNETDEIHFGDAGEGKVVAWARFGDAKTISKTKELVQAEQEYKEFSRKMIGQYGLTYTERVMSDSERQQESDLIAKLNQARKDHPQVEGKVLVIDEIQSKRHQEGREKGYRKDPWTLRKAKENLSNYIQHLKDKYRIDQVENLRHNILPSEGAEWKRLQDLYFEEAEYTGASRDERPYAAPFEKNWHELAMKRILRYAAENGYDKVAWTTGDQQAERYDIGEFIESITRNEDEDYPYSYEVVPVNGSYMNYDFDENGIYHDDGDPQMDGKSMEDIFGKDLAKRLKEMPAGEKLDGNGLRIGGEGMRGFYDDILPRFMQKYGKKWGVQVGEVTMPQLEDGYQTMHAIDINDAMRESVMEGQPMFSITPKNPIEVDEELLRDGYSDESPVLFSIAYHGSAEDFSKFLTDKIGTGEGSQTFGYGLYFTQAKEIAKDYAIRQAQKKNNAEKAIYDGKVLDIENPKTDLDYVARALQHCGLGYRDNTHYNAVNIARNWFEVNINYNKQRAEFQKKNGATAAQRGYEEEVALFERALAYINENGLPAIEFHSDRHLYEVSIPDDNGRNYLQDGTAKVRDIRRLLKVLTDEQKERLASIPVAKYTTGEEIIPKSDLEGRIKWHTNTDWKDLYEAAEIAAGGSKGASELFSKAGYVGIKYYAGQLYGLNGAKENTLNYVIFNDDDIEIKDHVLFSISGVRGAENMDRADGTNTRINNLEIARDMEQDGKDAKSIKWATGWERGGDGLWRYEIPDIQIKNNVTISKDANSVFRLPDLIDAPELFAAYPEMRDYRVTYTPNMPISIGGKFSKTNRWIYMNALTNIYERLAHKNEAELEEIRKQLPAIDDLAAANRVLWNTDPNDKEAMDAALELCRQASARLKDNPLWDRYRELDKQGMITEYAPSGEDVLAHEIQHAIQDIEGFARGSNLEDMDMQREYRRQSIAKLEQRIKDLEAQLPKPTEQWTEEHDAISQEIEDTERKILNLRNMNVQREAYNNAGGEVESRNVQARMKLTPEERRERLLSETEDVAREDQVFLFHNTFLDTDDILFSLTPKEQEQREKLDKVSKYIEDVLSKNRTLPYAQIEIPAYANHKAEIEIGHKIKSHSISANEVRHIKKRHGIGGSALTPESIPLRDEDIALLPYIMANPTRVKKGTPSANGSESVKYFKNLSNGIVVVVEREGKFGIEDMENITMWAERKSAPYVTVAQRASHSTSETIVIGNADILKIKQDAYDAIKKESEQNALFSISERKGTTNNPNAQIFGQENAENVQNSSENEQIDPVKAWEQANPKPEAKADEATIDYAKRLQEWNKQRKEVVQAVEDAKPSYDHDKYDGVLFSVTPPITGNTVGDVYAGAKQRSDLNQKRRESAAITDMLIKLSKDNYWRMQEALHKINADIKSLRRAMRLQSNLDKKQVEELLHLYQSLIESTSEWAKPGDMPETTGMIFKNIVESIGKEDITEQINNIMVYLSAAQRTAARNQWYKLRTTELKKLNISGVVTQGKVAVQGQYAIQALNEALAKDSGLTLKDLVGDAETGDEGLIGRMMEEEDKATTESLKLEYKGKWIGYTLAAQHMERMEQLNSERKELLADLRAAENNEHLKPFVKAELIERLRQSLVDNDIAKADAYMQSTTDLQEYVAMQTERAKNFLQHLEEWSRRIRNMAAEDLSGVQADPLGKDRKKSKVLADLSDWQFSTARDMQSLLRFLGRNTPDGKGALYNHYFYGYQRAADTEFKGIMEATDTMGKKVAEIFGKGYKTFEDVGKLCRQESKRLKLELKDVFDGVNNVDIPISVDNALYIYAVSKMDDGMDKLLAMNISREDVANLIKDIDPRLIQLVDWVQNEFFVNLRNRYNPTHESLYGAPMDKIENYFPLRIARGSLQKNVDVAEDENDASRLLPGTSTGAIKRRTKNAKPLDILAAGFLTETVRHITQMEKWNAFAQWTRDTNILLSDIMFRERVKALNSYIYGENGDVYAALKKAMQMANGTYKSAKESGSTFTLNVAKGATSAKINFRVWTAMKQIASHPAVIPYLTNAAAWKEYGKIMVNPYQALYGARQWALETLPAFQKRISKRDMGDMRLMRRAGDWEWQRKILEASAKYGMFSNMYVDTLTCAHIAKVAYESTKADLLAKGYTEEQATEKALLEAEIAFNTSQQSSESGYMAPVQSDRTWNTVVHTVFRVSPIQYTREWLYYGRNIGRTMKKGAKERMVDSRMRFYMLDGLSREQAQKAAESDYRKALAKDIAGFTVYGWLMNAVWRLMAAVPYLLLGDDDDEKKKLIKRAMTWGFYASPITGLFWGGALESALDRGDVAELFDKEMPVTSDIVKAARLIKGGKAAEVASASLNVLVQSTIGFDIAQFTENIADAVIAVKSDQDMSNFKKARLVAQAMMSVPKSQWEQVLIDKAVEDAPKQTNNAVAKRNYQKVYDKYLEDYIEYYSVHQAPLTFWARGEENEQKMRENAEKKYRKLLRERGIDKDVLPNTKASRDKKKR